jgi:hypothetical protein
MGLTVTSSRTDSQARGAPFLLAAEILLSALPWQRR